MAQTELPMAATTIACDSDLIERIRAQLSRIFTDPTSIEVRVRDGIVTLVGQIRDSAQSRAASLLTHRVHGVTNVVNKLSMGRASVLAAPRVGAPRRAAPRKSATRVSASVDMAPPAA